jgi:hypothetical protein
MTGAMQAGCLIQLKSGDIQGGGAPLFDSKMETYGNLIDADIS